MDIKVGSYAQITKGTLELNKVTVYVLRTNPLRLVDLENTYYNDYDMSKFIPEGRLTRDEFSDLLKKLDIPHSGTLLFTLTLGQIKELAAYGDLYFSQGEERTYEDDDDELVALYKDVYLSDDDGDYDYYSICHGSVEYPEEGMAPL